MRRSVSIVAGSSDLADPQRFPEGTEDAAAVHLATVIERDGYALVQAHRLPSNQFGLCTIGMFQNDLPELVVIGQEPAEAERLLRTLAGKMRADRNDGKLNPSSRYGSQFELVSPDDNESEVIFTTGPLIPTRDVYCESTLDAIERLAISGGGRHRGSEWVLEVGF